MSTGIRGVAMTVRFPNESSAYRNARNALLDAELALRRTMENVAAMRRGLPVGGVVPRDYVFRQSPANSAVSEVMLSELFASGRNSLAIYNFMFPRHPADDRLTLQRGRLPGCAWRNHPAHPERHCSISSMGPRCVGRNE
ncbi:MAG: DUF899 family protein [Propionivibrio sp.]